MADGQGEEQAHQEQASGWTVAEPAAQPPRRSVIRGLYDIRDDDVDEDVDNTMFREVPNGLLRFDTKGECKAFMMKHCVVGSNPDFPHLQHMFTMLVTWAQVERYLLQKVEYFNRKYPPRVAPAPDFPDNVYMQGAQQGPHVEKLPGADEWGDFDAGRVMCDVRRRLDLRFHQCITNVSTRNTLRYLFHHMRCGIYVMIRSNRLAMFVPFCNKDYTNDWAQCPRLPEGVANLKEYYEQKATVFRPENIIEDYRQWWANGNIICNEHQRPGEKNSQYWGDQFMSALRDLLEEACQRGGMADCEFFINKRDYPHLKYNEATEVPVEPYGFIFDKDDTQPDQDVPLKRHKYKAYTPIVSFYCSSRFADIPFPTSEDWEAAVGKVYPKTFTHKVNRATQEVEMDDPRDLFTQENFVKFMLPWEKKVDTAFFRGTATGGGVTIATNQRLNCAHLSHEWASDPKYNGKSDDTVPYLDAAITGWNKRDKKIYSEPMRYLRDADFPFTGGKENFTPIYAQSTYKYLIYIEGHCAACRYGFMMRMGSVILKVESSCVADLMWYFPLLQPWVDHVPVKADLSDLAEKIQWCRKHDDECRGIAARAGALYDKYVHKSACLDYVQALSYEINTRYRHQPAFVDSEDRDPWYPRPAPPPRVERDRNHKPKCHGDSFNVRGEYCLRCQQEMEADKAEVEKRKREAEAKKQATADKNIVARERMRRKAAAGKAAPAPDAPVVLAAGEDDFGAAPE